MALCHTPLHQPIFTEMNEMNALICGSWGIFPGTWPPSTMWVGTLIFSSSMRTSPNGNIFRVTGPLWGEPPATGGFPSQRLVTRSCDVFFDLCLNKRLSKQLRRWWFETPSRSLWRHSNAPLGVSGWSNLFDFGTMCCMLSMFHFSLRIVANIG